MGLKKKPYKYYMDYIPDKKLFMAVNFAMKMIREGQSPSRANGIAADYYGYDISDVAHYTAQRASRARVNRGDYD